MDAKDFVPSGPADSSECAPATQLRLSAADAAGVLEQLQHGVMLTDAAGLIRYLNKYAENTLGCSRDRARGVHADTLLNRARADQRDAVAQVKPSQDGRYTVQLDRQGGGQCTVEVRVARLADAAEAGWIYELRDISKSLLRTNRLIYEATHDPLTGLANRRALIERLNQLLEWKHQAQPESIFCILDLDGFKQVNDACGHLAGDEVLHDIARLIQMNIRKSDMAVRLGGDEFALLLIGCDDVEARRLIECIRREINDYRYRTVADVYQVTASIGAVNLDAGFDEIAQALRDADEACYNAKKAGGNCVFFSGQPQPEARPHAAAPSTRNDISPHYFNERNYVLYCQPIYALHAENANTRRADILLRWVGKQGKIVHPRDIFPFSRRYGFEAELDRFVLTKLLGLWAMGDSIQHRRPTECFVNLSRSSIVAAAETVDFAADLITEYKLPAGVLCFDIEERDILDYRQEVVTLTEGLRPHGVRFAVDGVGRELQLYSMSYLKGLSMDYIKLHAGLLAESVDDPMYAAFIDALTGLSRVLGAPLVGVGVESQEMLKRFMAFGIPYVQGYGLAAPEPLTTEWFTHAAASHTSVAASAGQDLFRLRRLRNGEKAVEAVSKNA